MLSSSPNNSFMFELDEEDANANTLATPNAHEFLNFSRRITARSLKKPVDTQVGIAYGKDLFFSHRRKPLLKNGVKVSSPLVHSTNIVNPTLPVNTDTINNNNNKSISNKTTKPNHPKVAPHLSASTPPSSSLPSPSPTVIPKSSALEDLVADVLNYIESCPDQSAYSNDLAILKPKLEAICSGKTR